MELLAIPQEPQRHVAQPSVHIGSAPGEGEAESRLLLRFAARRDPAMVAEWVSFHVIDTERQDWARGWSALRRFVDREEHARVPYGHQESAYPLGQWIAEQRRAYGAGQMPAPRVERLEQLGMVWDATDRRFQENLEAARAYFEQRWTLCAPRAATALGRPVGQWLSNLRRPGALEGRPEWDTALKAIDGHWRPQWPVAWQRHYAALRELVGEEAESTGAEDNAREGASDSDPRDGAREGAEGQQGLPGENTTHTPEDAQGEKGRGALAYVTPGVTVHGMDIGTWLERQRQPAVWHGLVEEQRELLAGLGVQPAPTPQKSLAKTSRGGTATFERGVAALAQYTARTGTVTVPRGHVETLPGGSEVKLGVWLSNQKSRRGRLSTHQLRQLTDLGLEWATT